MGRGERERQRRETEGGEGERGREKGGGDMYSFIHIATYVDYTCRANDDSHTPLNELLHKSR